MSAVLCKSRTQEMLSYALVVLLSVGFYANSLRGEFLFDDLIAVIGNSDVLPSTPWADLWVHDFWGQSMEAWQSHKSFRPLTIGSFRLSYLAAGKRFDELHFHAVNVAAHALISLLIIPTCQTVFISLGTSTADRAALIAALLFATHPIHTDAVSSIVSRAEMLSACMFIVSFLCYTRAAYPQKVRAGMVQVVFAWGFWLPLSMLLAFVGMLCKEQAITVMAVQVLYDVTIANNSLACLWQAMASKKAQQKSQHMTSQRNEEGNPPCEGREGVECVGVSGDCGEPLDDSLCKVTSGDSGKRPPKDPACLNAAHVLPRAAVIPLPLPPLDPAIGTPSRRLSRGRSRVPLPDGTPSAVAPQPPQDPARSQKEQAPALPSVPGAHVSAFGKARNSWPPKDPARCIRQVQGPPSAAATELKPCKDPNVRERGCIEGRNYRDGGAGGVEDVDGQAGVAGDEGSGDCADKEEINVGDGETGGAQAVHRTLVYLCDESRGLFGEGGAAVKGGHHDRDQMLGIHKQVDLDVGLACTQHEHVGGEVGEGVGKMRLDTEDEDMCSVRAEECQGGWTSLFLPLARLVLVCVCFWGMFSWRMSKNGPCITVYKIKGDPNISAWDAAGTVAPGIYSESSCKPNFLQIENPARFLRGPDASLTRLMTWTYLIPLNFRQLLFPWVLLADYSDSTIPLVTRWDDPRNMVTVVFFATFAVFALFCVRSSVRCCTSTRSNLATPSGHKADHSWLLSLAFLVAPFIPSSNVIFPVGFVIAERVLYTPSIGFCMLVALALNSIEKSLRRVLGGDAARIFVNAIGLITVLLYGTRTWVRNRDWRSREAFYEAIIRDNPTNAKGHYGYGVTIVHNPLREKQGVRHLQEAIRLQPRYFDAYSDLGAHYNRKGDYQKAAELFEHAVWVKPEHIHGISNLGLNYLAARDWEKAFLAFDRGVEFFPDNVEFHHCMGQALIGMGMGEDALDAYRNIINLEPWKAKSYHLYGHAAGQLGRRDEAEMYFRNAVRIDPRNVESLHYLGIALMLQGRESEAFPYFMRVLHYQPDYPGARGIVESLRATLLGLPPE